MVTSNKTQNFGNLIKQGKSQPVLWWMLIFSKGGMGSQEACAYEITQNAIRKGYTNPRKPIPGNTLNDWIKTNKAPYWACRSALDLCLKHQWQPQGDEQWAVFAHIWIRSSLSEQDFPEQIKKSEANHWIGIASDYDKAFREKKDQERKARLSPEYKAEVAIKAIASSVEIVARSEGIDQKQLDYWTSVVINNIGLLHDPAFSMAVNGWSESQAISNKVKQIIDTFKGQVADEDSVPVHEIAEAVLMILQGESIEAVGGKYDFDYKTLETFTNKTISDAPILFDQNFNQFKDDYGHIQMLLNQLDHIQTLVRERI